MDFVNLLSNFAFPVVACIAMGWYVKYITDKNSQEVGELNKQHTEEMMTFKEDIKKALDNNTKAIEKLCEKLN